MAPPTHMPIHPYYSPYPTLLSLYKILLSTLTLYYSYLSQVISFLVSKEQKYYFGVMDVAVELEDDLVFADLSKQISLLIMDEDEQGDPLACCPPDPLKVFYGEIIHPPPLSVIVYEQSVRRASKGTGVFIPQSTQPRRRHRRGRSGSHAKHQKQSEDKKKVSQAPNNSSYSFRSRNG